MEFLFERLARAGQYGDVPRVPFDMKEAVRAQIARIVSARPPRGAGSAMAAPEFGMPSVVELGQGDAGMLREYAARLTRMLREYEPRLAGPVIVLEATGDALAPYRLVVRGQLAGLNEPAHYTFALGAGQDRA